MNDNEFCGAKFDKMLTRVQIAALVRKDIKAEIRAGEERSQLLAGDEVSDLRVSKAAGLDLVPYLNAYETQVGL